MVNKKAYLIAMIFIIIMLIASIWTISKVMSESQQIEVYKIENVYILSYEKETFIEYINDFEEEYIDYKYAIMQNYYNVCDINVIIKDIIISQNTELRFDFYSLSGKLLSEEKTYIYENVESQRLIFFYIRVYLNKVENYNEDEIIFFITFNLFHKERKNKL